MNSRRVPHLSLLVILILIGVLNVIDFAVTQSLVVNGSHYELNPLMGRLIGTPFFTVYKLVLIPLGLVFLWFAPRSIVQRMKKLVFFALGVYASLMIYFLIVIY